MEYQNRNMVEDIYKWDLTRMFKSDDEWNNEYRKLKKEIVKILKFKGKLLESSSILLDALKTYFKLHTRVMKLYIYATTKFDEDLGNSNYSHMTDKATALYSELSQNASYMDPEILKGNKTTLNKILKAKELSNYHFYLTNLIRSKNHMLSEEEEILIAKLTENIDAFEKINSILTNSTLDYGKIMVDGEETIITNSNFRHIMTNRNQETRKECYTLLTSKLKEFENIFAPSLIAYMKTYNSLAQIRKFDSLLEMNLFDDNLPIEIYETLFETVESRLSVYHKYFTMVKTALGLNKLEYYDKYAEIISENMSFTIEEAKILLEKSLSILGDGYLDIINRAFDERWIDFGTYKGKSGGAYCTDCYGCEPYILMNFHGKFNDVSTLAHELGHLVNSVMSQKKNNAHDYFGGLFLAEVASLTNEVLLSHYIMNNSSDKNFKLTAISSLLDTIQNNLFDACLEGKLEYTMYNILDKNEEIGLQDLNESIYKIRKEYYGKSLGIDESIKVLWSRRAHYFTPYYLFKYATGISVAVYVAKKIISDEDDMRNKYLNFLSKGNTDYPHELLKEMGVDLTNPTCINEAIDYMDYLINEFNRISEEE